MEAQVVETSDTPVWDTLPTVIQNNIARQHREGGIRRIALPRAKWQLGIVLDPFQEAVKAIQRKIKANAEKRKTVQLKADFVALQKEEIALLAELETAKKARKDKREACPHTATTSRLRKTLKASQWIRTNQVIEILGPLTPEDMTDADDAEIAEHLFAVKRQKKLQALGRL